MWIRASRRTGRVKNYDGSRTHCLGIYRAPRSPLDAAPEPLARPAVDPLLDDCGDAHGRRLALVRARDHPARLWRTAALLGSWSIGGRSGRRDIRLQGPEESEPPPAPLPPSTSFLFKLLPPPHLLLPLPPHPHPVLHP